MSNPYICRMRPGIFILIALLITLLFSSCRERTSRNDVSGDKGNVRDILYAKGFSITDYGNYKKLEVLTPYPGANTGFTYYLVKQGQEVPEGLTESEIIEVPVQSIVCTSTTHIPLLEYLGVEEALKGFPNTDYISSRKVRQRINLGFVTDLGQEMSMNTELLMALDPDVVMGYMMTGDLGQLGKIRQAGIPVVINAEYLEEHPLGRAEWIKFMGALVDREDVADSVFHMIESSYRVTLEKVKDAKSRPSVMSGVVYGDTWFLPGGNNYAAKLINDAEGQYLWENESTSGFLEKSFESVYERAYDVDFWVGVASYNSLQQLTEGDVRYANFKAFKAGRVYSYNNRMGAKGGNEYLELGYLRPDLILKDLVSIFHPDLSEDHELYFFKKLD